MKKHFLLLGVVSAALALFTIPAQAANGPAAADTIAQASPAPSPSPSATPTPKPFQFSAFEDVGFQSASVASGKNVISGRVFDLTNGNPQQHSLNLTASYTGTLGGKVEITYGDDAEILHSYPYAQAFNYTNGFGKTSQFDLTQAYGSYTSGKATLIAGKFATLAGAEVIESPSDMNYSRSILFGYAIPFKHTGARVTWAASPAVSLIVGANKGWDTTSTIKANGDTTSLTGEYGIAWNPSSVFSATAQAYTGNVEAWNFNGCATSSCSRSLLDIVATYHYSSAITLVGNLDSGSQTNTLLPSGGTGTAKWSGFAGYISDALSPKVTATVRAESFKDTNGYRAAFAGNYTGGSLTLTEITGTVQYALYPNVTVRAEMRGDNANMPYFIRSNGTGQANTTNFGLEVIVHTP